jgi:mannose PTS system EIIA component
MIGLVIASHGHLAEAFEATAKQIVGPIERLACVSVVAGACPEEMKAQIKESVRQVSDGHGVLVMTDLLGGSPCMQSLSMCLQLSIEVVTGVNLPMVLKAASLREHTTSVSELAHALADYGQRSITCPSERLRQTQQLKSSVA